LPHEQEASGYSAASEALQAEVNALTRAAEALGIDADSIKVHVHEATEHATERETVNQPRVPSKKPSPEAVKITAKLLAMKAMRLAASRGQEVVAQQERAKQGAADEARRKAEDAARAKADAERDEFTLTGSDRPADVAAAAGRQDIFGAKPEVSQNKIFTEDAAAARALLKKKLGTLNSGIDPEMIQAGITLAGYHIEKGARTFAAYAKAMVEDLGEAIKPHFKSFYMAVKHDMRAADFKKEMSSEEHVEAHDLDAIKAEPAPKENPAPSAEFPAAKDGGTLADTFNKAISEGKMPKDNVALKRMV
jgi:hypothetical protein